MNNDRKRGRGRSLPKLNHHLEDEQDRKIEKYFGTGRSSESAQGRRQAQYCQEAERLIRLVLCGEWTDPLLDGLEVVGVQPSDDNHQLIVELQLPIERAGANLAEIEARLESASRLLRAELAAHVKRKRTPALRFVVYPASKKEGEA